MQLQVSYAIGMAKPISININSFNTGIINDKEIENLIIKNFDLRPKAIIDKFDLLNPIYKKTACYGHFGREEFPWEKTDMAQSLKKQTKI